MTLTTWVIGLAPVGVFFLIGGQVIFFSSYFLQGPDMRNGIQKNIQFYRQINCIQNPDQHLKSKSDQIFGGKRTSAPPPHT